MDMQVAPVEGSGGIVPSPFQLIPKTYVFFSEGGLPANAGIADLCFGNVPQPTRQKRVITFPSRQGELVYYPIKGGQQFVVTVGDSGYFGGTDDNPDDEPNVFLAEVTAAALEAFYEWGEAAFFESLKPGVLKHLEEVYPEGITRRQGDVFAFWCPAFGRTSTEFMSYTQKRQKETGSVRFVLDSQTRDNQIFRDTRHTISGTVLGLSYVSPNKQYTEGYYTGLLQAPDHRPLNLGKRPHRLFQAVNLVRPTSGCGDR